MKTQNKFGPAKIILIILSCLIGSLLLSVGRFYFLSFEYRLTLEYIEQGSVPVERLVGTINDRLILELVIEEYKARNSGEHPSVEYIMETISPDYPRVLKDIQIKNEETSMLEKAFLPEFGELHIWIGYNCSDISDVGSFQEYDFSASSNISVDDISSYDMLLDKESDWTAEVYRGYHIPLEPPLIYCSGAYE